MQFWQNDQLKTAMGLAPLAQSAGHTVSVHEDSKLDAQLTNGIYNNNKKPHPSIARAKYNITRKEIHYLKAKKWLHLNEARQKHSLPA